jgi:hypothetical protein
MGSGEVVRSESVLSVHFAALVAELEGLPLNDGKQEG